jgi:hypothetical protein
MLRIMAVQRSEDPQREYVLLQNHGSLRIALRGHMLADDCGLEGANRDHMFVFTDDAQIPAMAYVLLVSGSGKDGWYQDSDARPVYCVYWNRKQAVWSQAADAIHLLHVIHTNKPRSEGLVITR